MENLYIRSVKIKEDLPDDEYYSKLAVIRSIKKHELKFESPVTFFVSENGMGKSTITEAIAISLGFNAEGGTRNFNFSTKSSHSDLYKYLKITKGIEKVHYSETEHFMITKRFMDAPEKMHEMLFD